jgi:adenosylmethionine-8-amino-7-oxononanoate aminotransferase
VGCAAAIANLDVFALEGTLAVARRHADALADALRRHVEPRAHVGPVRRTGTMVGFDLWADPAERRRYPTDERRAHRAVLAAREEGVVVRPLADTMVLMPPLAMPADLIERLVAATARAVERATVD